MSAALLGLALKAKLHSQTRKMVLIKLVDCCHEDGTRIYPSLATIAEDAECSVPTARRVMQTFCRVGLLRKVRDGGSGARSTNHYEMDVELLARLRRPELWPALEAAAQHDPIDESDDESEASGHAQNHAQDAEQAPSPCENKGITVEGYHRDTLPNGAEGYHPDDTQPLSRTLSDEREGVRGREGAPASEGERDHAHAAGAGPEPALPASLDDFRAAYPHAGADDQAALRSAWEAVPFAERRAAIDGIPGFLAERKAAGFASRLSAPKYLSGRNWRHVPKQAAERAARQAAGAMVQFDGWSRDWWLLLLDRVFAGRPPGFWMQQAESRKPLSATSADLAAAAQRIGDLTGYLGTGPEIEAWRPWLAERGARIPAFEKGSQARVFLPAPLPPGGRKQEGDDDVAF
ncbi:MAG: hypothetical protein DI527_00960 [Chelatococcus sp.]|nr:MAG: hypothetical protein DI527_00960 [Chelatococcus sp.]